MAKLIRGDSISYFKWISKQTFIAKFLVTQRKLSSGCYRVNIHNTNVGRIVGKQTVQFICTNSFNEK